MSWCVAAALARPGDDGHGMDMWTARVCTLASSRPPPARKLFHARYHITALSLGCGVKQRKAEALLLSLLHVLGRSQGQVFLTRLLPMSRPTSWEVSPGTGFRWYQRQLLRLLWVRPPHQGHVWRTNVLPAATVACCPWWWRFWLSGTALLPDLELSTCFAIVDLSCLNVKQTGDEDFPADLQQEVLRFYFVSLWQRSTI